MQPYDERTQTEFGLCILKVGYLRSNNEPIQKYFTLSVWRFSTFRYILR